jgi:hypothetical protein
MVTRIHHKQPTLRGVHTRTTESSNEMALYNYAVGTVAELITNFNHPFPEPPYLPLTPALSTAGAQFLGHGAASWSRFSREGLQSSSKRPESRL